MLLDAQRCGVSCSVGPFGTDTPWPFVRFEVHDDRVVFRFLLDRYEIPFDRLDYVTPLKTRQPSFNREIQFVHYANAPRIMRLHCSRKQQAQLCEVFSQQGIPVGDA
ncbi:MAG TPA: hypothetical protein VFD32_16130 [Dehalococcoidia bacterium]|nr:hypothetical protein [Dehalococcoidia bacterium]